MIAPEELQKSIVLITSKDSQNSGFGTGFVVKTQGGNTYVLTCAHVVREVGGDEQLQIEGKKGIIIASGEEEGLDLAVVRVEGLESKPSLKLEKGGETSREFITSGFQRSGKLHLLKNVRGKLGSTVGVESQFLGERLQAWELNLSGENGLQRGYSGSPIVEEMSGKVIAVASHRQGERKGLALGIEEVTKIWEFVDSEQLYRTLAKLGYRQQVRLFQRLIKSVTTAALLIYGPPEYGQRWLLNLLLVNYLPQSDISQVVKIHLKRRGRSLAKSVITRELCRTFGVEPNRATLEEIANKIYQCLQTRNVLVIFDYIDCVGEENVRKILEKLWQPLLRQISAKEVPLVANKLFLFLIDYQGKCNCSITTGGDRPVYSIEKTDGVR